MLLIPYNIIFDGGKIFVGQDTMKKFAETCD